MSARLQVFRVLVDGGVHEIRVCDEDEAIIEVTPHAALWLAQKLVREARLALREDEQIADWRRG